MRLRPTKSARSQVKEDTASRGLPEADPVRELGVVVVPREDRAGRLVALGRHEAPVAGTGRAHAPLDVAVHAEPARGRRGVRQREHGQLHGIVWRDEDRQLLLETGCGVLIAGRPGRVTDHPAAGAGPARQRRRRGAPHRAGVVVAKKDGLAGRIGNRIVGERRQPVLAAVLGPGKGRPRRAHHRSEVGVRQDVGPRQRRLAIPLEHDDVFAAVWREAADAVVHDERRDRDGRGCRLGRTERRRTQHELLGVEPGRRPVQLGSELAQIAAEHDLRGSRQQTAIVFGHPVRAQQKDAARLVLPRRPAGLVDEIDRGAAASRRGTPRGARSG